MGDLSADTEVDDSEWSRGRPGHVVDIVPGLVGIEYLGYLPAKDLSFKIINKLLCHYLI